MVAQVTTQALKLGPAPFDASRKQVDHSKYAKGNENLSYSSVNSDTYLSEI